LINALPGHESRLKTVGSAMARRRKRCRHMGAMTSHAARWLAVGAKAVSLLRQKSMRQRIEAGDLPRVKLDFQISVRIAM